jgi:hypothetical protein
VVRRFRRPVASPLLATVHVPIQLVEMSSHWLLVHHDEFVLPFFPGGRHLPGNFLGRDIKGRIAAVRCAGGLAIESSHFLSVGVSRANLGDRRGYHQDDLASCCSLPAVHAGTDPQCTVRC